MGRAMAVVGDRADVAVNIRIKVTTALPMVNAARNDMPQMRDHACADEELSLRVVVDAPRIAKTVRDHLEAILNWVITPTPPLICVPSPANSTFLGYASPGL